MTLPTSTSVGLLVCADDNSVMFTMYPSASLALTAVQLMVIPVAFLWGILRFVGVKLGAVCDSVVIIIINFDPCSYISCTSDICL